MNHLSSPASQDFMPQKSFAAHVSMSQLRDDSPDRRRQHAVRREAIGLRGR
ncbi:MAG: hypothetical protein NTW75_00590 [Planctomycetales bacterium]|jgi:hypothetical protein|nr:hypothetical protein [Planctomycetales bacterium]